MSALLTPIKHYYLILLLVWTVLVACSFAWTYSQQNNNVIEIARSEARIAIQKDTLYRKWASRHGGVYVPVTPDTPPNQYLPEHLERDITAPSGKALTLINPAYMTRQVFELAAKEKNLVRGHITSLKPIRPDNAPDQWESAALAAFEKGAPEVSEVSTIEGQQYLRLMRPFVTEQPCLKCHAAQGYQTGDVRGGISVSVPLSMLSASSNKMIAGTGAAHALIWIAGVCMISLGSRKLSRSAADINEKNLQLEDEIAERQLAQEQLQEQTTVLEEEIAARQLAQETLQDQAVMLEEEIAERVRAEAIIVQSEKKFANTFQNAPMMMAISKLDDGTILDINNKFVELSGYSREELIGKSSLELGLIDAADRAWIFEEYKRHGRVIGMDLDIRTKHGKQISTLYFGEPLPEDNQTTFLSVCLDVTEQRQIEAQLLHAQKMEAIGTLAGGVAHDFNNVLTVISGYASLLSMKLDRDSNEFFMANEINASVNRAVEMTRSLLAFSRKEPMSTKPEDVNKIVLALEKSLRRLIREDIEFRYALADRAILVMADKGQLEQVLINLVVNARDAMPSGGMLSISSSIVEVSDGDIGFSGLLKPGVYGLLSVSDTGFGMDRETRERIFEPFFTTKEINKGTGLGLSIVHTIITNHNGKIDVYSEKGHGTTFRIYLPLLDQTQREEHPEQLEETIPGGDETILLADDDADVLTVTTLLLENYGYRVLVANNGEAALSLFKENQEAVRLLISDVIMPRMNGRELAEEVGKLQANVPVIFMSGYAGDVMEENFIRPEDAVFLSKPIKSSHLLVAVRRLLDA